MGLNGCTICHSFIWVHGIIQLLSVEKVAYHLTNLRNASGTTYHDHFVNIRLGHLCIIQNLLQRCNGAAKNMLAKRLKPSTSHHQIQINTIYKGIDLNGGLSRSTQATLGSFTRGAKTSQGTWIILHSGVLILALEFLHTPIYHDAVKIFTTQVSIARSSLHFKDAIINGDQ